MYLNLLNEDFKKLFISFAYKLTLVDSVFFGTGRRFIKKILWRNEFRVWYKKIKEINSSFDELRRIEFIVDK